MIPALFDLVSQWSPAIKRCLWRAWYEYLAHTCEDRDWAFMNFGYRDLALRGRPPELFPSDEQDRLAIQLYHHLLTPVDVRGRDVLEVGCGRGGGCSYVRRYFEPRSVTGLDFSRRAIALCRRHYGDAGLSFQWGDAESMPFPDRTFDVVINVEASHCYVSIGRAISEVRRVLREGGYFLFADLRRTEEIPLLHGQLNSSGLHVVREELITANVVAALAWDHERKATLIRLKIPRLFRTQFQQFAGLRDTAIYEAMRDRRVEYLTCVLRKMAD